MDTSSVERNSGSLRDDLSTLPTGVGSLTELADDLSALKAGTPGSVGLWASRPAVLRRVALLVSSRIPAQATRVIATGEGAVVLATAVAMTAGLSFAVWNDGAFVFGEAHPSEDVALIAVNHSDLAAVASWCEQRSIAIAAALSVFGPAGQGSLFVSAEHGRVEEGATL
jgi:hypothetical protein